MFEKLDAMLKRFNELTELISDPETVAKRELWQSLVKERAALEEVAEKYSEYLKAEAEAKECREMANAGGEMAELAEAELAELKKKSAGYVEELKILLIPRDPMDDKNVIIEIRGGAGGEEASLFAGDLKRMYHRFAERMRWKVEEINLNGTELGGVKEAVFMLNGKGAYSKMKYESGVHRVQRVPETESQGRVHTSTCTVAVLPEAEEVVVDFNEKDFKIDTYRSGGAGGQHVNKTESAVRITHIPTGIVVECQDERSQIKNREKAWKVMNSRLYDHFRTQKDKEYAANRKTQVGTGDRSERIRTYNFPQGRVTDHRIGLTLYNLNEFMDGDMFQMIEALQLYDRNLKLGDIEGK